MTIDLTGKVALVTGATRGIGRAIAVRLAEHKASIVSNSRGGDEAGAAKLAERYGVDVMSIAADVADPAEVSAMMQAVFKRFGRLDILVNNAGILRDGLIGMIRTEDIDATIGTNVGGTLNTIQAGARLMGRTGGSIVNLSSIMGVRGNAGQLVYCASKGAVLAATLAAAKELAAKKIRVNAIAPGFIETDFVAELPDDIRDARLASIAFGRAGSPEEVADVALFLASDLSRYVTGQVIGVDGGMVV